jgi:hypothetical protein
MFPQKYTDALNSDTVDACVTQEFFLSNYFQILIKLHLKYIEKVENLHQMMINVNNFFQSRTQYHAITVTFSNNPDPLPMPKQIFNQEIYRQPLIQTLHEANIYPYKPLSLSLSTGVSIQFL